MTSEFIIDELKRRKGKAVYILFASGKSTVGVVGSVEGTRLIINDTDSVIDLQYANIVMVAGYKPKVHEPESEFIDGGCKPVKKSLKKK